MVGHWTERSTKDYHFRIAADFINQLEEKMEAENITQDKLSQLTGLTKGRISQVLNNPGNMTLGNIVKFSRAVGLKVSLVAYDDHDPDNTSGPINSDIFKICWEKSGKPHDFWAIQEKRQNIGIAYNMTTGVPTLDKFVYPQALGMVKILNTAVLDNPEIQHIDRLVAMRQGG